MHIRYMFFIGQASRSHYQQPLGNEERLNKLFFPKETIIKQTRERVSSYLGFLSITTDGKQKSSWIPRITIRAMGKIVANPHVLIAKARKH